MMETSNDGDLSFDIIECLPEDICDIIFGNLKSPDLLKASLVSKQWYKFIAKSAVCMKKLELMFSPEELNETRLVKRILKNSARKYENIEFKKGLKLIDMRSILLICGRKWKEVTVTFLNFPTDLDFINFITIVEPFVEKLTIKYVQISSAYPKKRKLSEQKKSLTFPNLKFLEADCCATIIVEQFQDVVTLTEFNYLDVYPSTSAVNPIQKMMRYNKGLKKLSTNCISFDSIFSGKVSKGIAFKLTSLQVRGRYVYWPEEHTAMGTNFKQFLELHMNTLETLYVDDWMGLETAKVIFHMSKLKHLFLNAFSCDEETLDWKTTNFKQSSSLISLDFSSEPELEMLKAIITATPNVKKLTLYSIKDKIITCISELLPNLESLSVVYFKVLDVTNKSFLPNLKELSMQYYFQPVKESAVNENRSKFESLFIAKKNTAKKNGMMAMMMI